MNFWSTMQEMLSPEEAGKPAKAAQSRRAATRR